MNLVGAYLIPIELQALYELRRDLVWDGRRRSCRGYREIEVVRGKLCSHRFWKVIKARVWYTYTGLAVSLCHLAAKGIMMMIPIVNIFLKRLPDLLMSSAERGEQGATAADNFSATGKLPSRQGPSLPPPHPHVVINSTSAVYAYTLSSPHYYPPRLFHYPELSRSGGVYPFTLNSVLRYVGPSSSGSSTGPLRDVQGDGV